MWRRIPAAARALGQRARAGGPAAAPRASRGRLGSRVSPLRGELTVRVRGRAACERRAAAGGGEPGASAAGLVRSSAPVGSPFSFLAVICLLVLEFLT